MQPLQQNLLSEPGLKSAKRARNERNGIHAWLPYYAGYSESFVTSAIEYLGLDESNVVLDPWNGSGTTGLVCQHYGIPSIGLDINPAMTYFAAGKSGTVIGAEQEIHDTLKRLGRLRKARPLKPDDALLEVYSPSLASSIRHVHSYLRRKDRSEKALAPALAQCLQPDAATQKPIEAFLVAGLFVTSRLLAEYKRKSNPTWFGDVELHANVSVSDFVARYQDVVTRMLRDLRASGIETCDEIMHAAITGDSRAAPIRTNSVDAIITSPPYLTRIDYAVSTRPELLILGDSDRFREVRVQTMGAPVITGEKWEARPEWGASCNSLLEKIAVHKTKAAKSYYFKNIVQYFSDAERSLRELIRVLRPGGRALVVVQSSYFKELEMPLGDLYVEMAENAGNSATIARREVVKGHLAHVNTKSSQYISNKVYYEDVVEIQKA